MNRLLVSWVMVGAIALTAVAVAGELPDPTRPPAALRPASTSASPSMAAAPVLVLQSVLIGEGRKPMAIINGRVVEQGDSLDGLRLVRVFDGGALLAGPNGTKTLALTPDSEKVAAAAQPHAQPLLAMTRPTRRLDAGSPMVRTGDRK
jgi:MSHA biogenesis protein MshK